MVHSERIRGSRCKLKQERIRISSEIIYKTVFNPEDKNSGKKKKKRSLKH